LRNCGGATACSPKSPQSCSSAAPRLCPDRKRDYAPPDSGSQAIIRVQVQIRREPPDLTSHPREWPRRFPAPAAAMAGRWRGTGRCGACHPSQQLPYHVTAQVRTDHGDMLSWTRPLSRYSRHRVFNLTRPEKSLFLMAALSRRAGGYADGQPASGVKDAKPVAEDRSRPPQAIRHPIVFSDTIDADYQLILTHLNTARVRLDEIKRFDMPGFQPNEHYVREMQRYGVLPESFDLTTDPIDVYTADRAYWETFWHRPHSSEQ